MDFVRQSTASGFGISIDCLDVEGRGGRGASTDRGEFRLVWTETRDEPLGRTISNTPLTEGQNLPSKPKVAVTLE